ncbi:MAG TPA: biopolymer transporter Tol, partial [Ignavibacteriales bacterium]|nr:biopolymer transporter Tol [Ignavibacteriales bacterium]
LKTGADERNPSFKDENTLSYSSDETGIFNLYSLNLNTNEKKQISNVVGGAFMAASNEAEDVAYAGYTSVGYKIFLMNKDEQANVDSGKKYIRRNNPPIDASLPNGDLASSDADYLKNFNDKEAQQYVPQKYSGSFTSPIFFPFVRYDNYNTSNSAADRIKPGLAIFTNDMIDRYTFFASGSINKRWERDLYFSFEYRNKLPLLFDLGIKPELVADFYSISRKANTDLLLKPDKTGTEVEYDIRIPDIEVTYNLLEFDLAARHRLFNKAHNVELRYIFSKYTATIGSFLLPVGNDEYIFSQKSNDVYLIGSNYQFLYTLNADLPYLNSDINPVGLNLKLQLNYEMNRYNPDGDYEVTSDGVLKPSYENFNFPRAELDINMSSKTFDDHTLSLRMRGGAIVGPAMPDFFDSYVGGLLGMKSYPFYSISGNDIAWINLTYRFPLFQNIDYRFGHLYMDKVYFSVFGDMGDAWTEAKPKFKNFKKGVGAELRLKLVSYYIYPTSIFVSAAYGFDKLERTIQDETVRYGKEWQFYGGILYDFSL